MVYDPYYYTRGLFQQQSQRQALGQTKGFTPEEVSSVVGAGVEAERAIGERERQYGLQVRSQQQQEKAEKSRAITGLVGLGINAPLAYFAARHLLATPGASTAATTGLATGAGSATGTVAAPAALTTSTGVATGVETLPALSTGAYGTAALGTAGTAAAGTTAVQAGTISGAGAALAPIGVGLLAGAAAYELNKKFHITRQIAHTSIICTELNRQGLLDDSMLRASSLYVKTKGDKQAYIGYLIFATPIVEAMKKSRVVTKIMKPYGEIMSRECASRVCKRYKSTWFSRLVYTASEKFYKEYFYWKFRNLTEVIYG